jgi:hypothetical protein
MGPRPDPEHCVMATVFLPFWRLRQHAVAEEVVRGGSRRRRADGPWTLSLEVRERLRELLKAHGLDPERETHVEEPPGQDGFTFSQ